MITIMHVLTQRFSYNVEQQRATHFIVDEAQYVCRHETSCNELEKAYLTYRKLGGICTICLQNVSAATANRKIMEIVSNSDFKVLLDQAGDDRNELLQIMELSQKEFEALSDPTPGQSLIVWGGHILQCDSTISRDNPLYHSTVQTSMKPLPKIGTYFTARKRIKMNMKMIWNPCQRLTRMKTETRCQHLTLIQTKSLLSF